MPLSPEQIEEIQRQVDIKFDNSFGRFTSNEERIKSIAREEFRKLLPELSGASNNQIREFFVNNVVNKQTEIDENTNTIERPYYIRSTSTPPTPTANTLESWSRNIPDGSDNVWVSNVRHNVKDNDAFVSATTPIRDYPNNTPFANLEFMIGQGDPDGNLTYFYSTNPNRIITIDHDDDDAGDRGEYNIEHNIGHLRYAASAFAHADNDDVIVLNKTINELDINIYDIGNNGRNNDTYTFFIVVVNE